MPVSLQDNFAVGSPQHIDSRYGPWVSTNAAKGLVVGILGIPQAFRFKGLTIGVLDASNNVVEWWWKDGVTDNDLIIKTSGSGNLTNGNGILFTTSGTSTSVEIDTSVVQLKSLLSNTIVADAANTAKYPSVKAIKDYVDSLAVGLLNDRGPYNPNTTSLYPTSANNGSGSGGQIKKGDIWFISTAGSINGISVPAGASVRALDDNPGQTNSKWDILDAGFGYIPENIANKQANGTDITNDPTSATKYPSVKAMVEYIAGVAAGVGGGIDDVIGRANSNGSIPTSESQNKNLVLNSTGSTDYKLSVKNTNGGSAKRSEVSPTDVSIFNTNTQKAVYGYNSITYTDTSSVQCVINITPNSQTIDFPSVSGTLLTSADLSSYLTIATAATTYQPLDSDLTTIAGLSGDGFLIRTSGTWSFDTNTYVKTSIINVTGSGLNYIAPGSGTESLQAYYNTSISGSIKNVAVGGLAANTYTADQLRVKSMVSILDEILFPLINPTYVAPTYSLGSSISLAEIGASGVRPTLTGTFNRGAINISGVFQAYRAGSVSTSGSPRGYNFTGTGLSVTNQAGNSTTYTSDLTITIGSIIFSSTVYYDQGPQPLDSRGANSGSPLAAGSLTATTSLEGVYPIYATTVALTTQTKQTLYSMVTGNNIELTLVAEAGGDKQKFWLPEAWTTSRALTAVYQKNATGTYDPTNTIGLYTVTTTTIGGVNYKQYQYNSTNRGSVTIKLVF